MTHKKTTGKKKPVPLAPTRVDILKRDNDNLSSYDLNCKIYLLRAEQRSLEQNIAVLKTSLAERTLTVRFAREDADALETLLEKRR